MIYKETDYQHKKRFGNTKSRIKLKTVKIVTILIAIIMVIGFTYLGRVAEKSRNNSRELIKEYGTEVDCRLIYKYETQSNKIYHYHLFLDFHHGDSIVELKSQSFDFDREDFEKAIIGLKYKALVILDGKNKFEYSKILLDKPLKQSFSRVDEEREDIKLKYKSADRLIKKYGRTGKELDKIWEKYYK
ncbi:hypothetical protein [Maribellus maritimus]|uniref:hypothetical protein n=1 Tax=Maribellus maritimus TaxID=2870838 RepID=UPI001EEA2162|nr:hypothetical protein [Maribellus maritimus]MCG6190183.1 hypothetical protein [Maribellus maritimus]